MKECVERIVGIYHPAMFVTFTVVDKMSSWGLGDSSIDSLTFAFKISVYRVPVARQEDSIDV